MLRVVVGDDEVRIGDRFAVTFQRTLRIPDDGRTYPLPPGLGRFPLLRVAELGDRAPRRWRERGGVVIPMHRREALWLGFAGADWKPNAVQVAVGEINAISGAPWDEALSAAPQNYLVAPYQPWLDGINVGAGVIRQFVAVPLGQGDTVEGQVTGAETTGGIQLRVYEPRPGRFPDRLPSLPNLGSEVLRLAEPAGGAMGMGAGGAMRQRIYPDPYGVETWDPDNRGALFVHVVESARYRALTGREPPATPIEAATYTEYGLPWFDLYDDERGTVAGSDTLREVRSVGSIEAGRGEVGGDRPLAIDPGQVRRLEPPAAGARRSTGGTAPSGADQDVGSR